MDLCGLHFQGTVCHCEKLRREQELEAEILEEFCFLAHSLIGSCLAGVLVQHRTTCLGREGAAHSGLQLPASNSNQGSSPLTCT